jgi:hypothetical protein
MSHAPPRPLEKPAERSSNALEYRGTMEHFTLQKSILLSLDHSWKKDERVTRLELATSTLARLHSTN